MRSVFLATAALSIIATSALGQGVDPILGTWKMNVEKSMVVGGQIGRSQTLTYTRDGQNIVNNVESVDAQGRASKGVLIHVYDGKPHPSTGSPDYDSTAYTRAGNTISWVRFKNGKPVIVGQGVFDDKIYTLVQGGINASNQPTYAVIIYDRQ
jgi:hypothetical protein